MKKNKYPVVKSSLLRSQILERGAQMKRKWSQNRLLNDVSNCRQLEMMKKQQGTDAKDADNVEKYERLKC